MCQIQFFCLCNGGQVGKFQLLAFRSFVGFVSEFVQFEMSIVEIVAIEDRLVLSEL